MLRSNNARGRIGLLASSSLVASTLMAGLGGVALTAFTPGAALAACIPAAGTNAGTATIPGIGAALCQAGPEAGVYYKDVPAGNFTLGIIGDQITTNGVSVTTGNVSNLSVAVFTDDLFKVPTQNINNNAGAGVTVTSGGGNVEFDSGSTGSTVQPGATVTGSTDGVDLTTTGAGTASANLLNDVTGTAGNGVSISSGSGAVTVQAQTATGGGVNVTGGANGIVVGVTGGGAINITTPGSTTGTSGDGIDVAGGNTITITAGNVTGVLDGIQAIQATGNINVTTNGTATGGAVGFGIRAGGDSNTTIIANGNVVNGVEGASATGAVTSVTINSGSTGANGVHVDGPLPGLSGDGTAVIVLNGGNVDNANNAVYGSTVGADESAGPGDVTITSKAGVDITDSGGGAGVIASTNIGNITINLAGTVGAGAQVAGDGIDATTAFVPSESSISITTAGVNSAHAGINANNQGSGTTLVHLTGNVTAGGAGIIADTFSQNLANGSGDDQVTLDANVSVTAGAGAISETVRQFGSGNVTIGANDTISAGNGAGIAVTSTGTGSINILTATKDDQSSAIAVSGAGQMGIQAIAAGTGGINIDFGGNIGSTAANVDGDGIDAEITNSANASGITVRAGNISSGSGVGLFAQTAGAGDISVTTLKGTDVNSQQADGIDAFAMGGGNVTVTLLDGTVHSNASGSASGIFASGGVSGSGPSAPGPKPTGPIDPHAVHMITVLGGTATLNQNSSVANNGDGDAILSQTVNGANTLNLNANVSNVESGFPTFLGGNGVLAETTGTGAVTINLFNVVTPAGEATQTANQVNVSTFGGSGILAENTDLNSGAAVKVTSTAGSPGPFSVTVTSGLSGSTGIGAITNSDGGILFNNQGASVDLSNAPAGNIGVEGAGDNTGIEALALDTGNTSFAGSASVITGANLTIAVGTLGGNGDTGVLAFSQDGGSQTVSVTVGDSNNITVGSVGSTHTVGVLADSAGNPSGDFIGEVGWAGGTAVVTLGNLDVVTVTGEGAIGVESFVAGGNFTGNDTPATVTIGNGGVITVHDSAATPGVGVFALDNDTGSSDPATVNVGSTTVTIDHGDGIVSEASGNNSASATSLGNITAGGRGLMAITANGDAFANYNNTGNGSMTDNFGGNVGVGAIATGGNASATVNIGNGVGDTVIHGTNSGTVSIGVLASATGTGNASITSNGNVTVDPTEFAQQSITPLGQAMVVTGLNDSNSVSDPLGVAPQHVGLFAFTGQTAGTASAFITIAGNNTISVTGLTGNMSGSVGAGAFDDGGGSVIVKTSGAGGKGGTGLSITVGGDDSAGIAASTVGGDGVGGFFGGNLGSAGAVTVNTATGQITVGAVDTTGTDANNNFANGYGIYTAAAGGAINVQNNANISVSNGGNLGTIGISSTNIGAGNIDIGAPTVGTLIQTTNGDGILAQHVGKGSGFVTVGGGANGIIEESITTNNISGGHANGIEATTAGTGTVSVNQGVSSTITTLGTLGQDAGISASNTAGAKFFGDVTVVTSGNIATNAGVITGTGTVFGTGGTASVNVVGQGVVAQTNGNGNILVTQTTTGNITTLGESDGIDAVNTSQANGNIVVNVAGLINAGADGVAAVTTTNDDVTVNVTSGGNITGNDGVGIGALNVNKGEGTVMVLTSGTTNVSGSAAGIQAETNGAGVITVDNGVAGSRAGGTVSSSAGTGIIAINTDTANSGDVFVDNEGNITGAGTDGIFAAVGSAGNTTNNASVIVTTGSVHSTLDGVDAETFGTGSVTVTTNAVTNGGATLVQSTTGNGIFAEAHGGTNKSNVIVTANGAVQGGADGVVAVGLGSGTVLVTGNASITGNLDGVASTTVNGTNTVNIIAGTTSSLVDGNGVNASTTGNGSIKVTVSHGATVEGGPGGNLDNGILAQTGGSGTIGVTISGNVGTLAPATSWGVNAIGDGGAVLVTENANGIVTDGGIRAVNLTGNLGTATVNVAGTTINTGQDGVLVQTTAGTASVNIKGNATVTADTVAGQNGVEVDTTTGPVEVTGLSTTSTINATHDGILGDASGLGGTVTITYDGSTNATDATGAGIAAITDNGAINVNTGGGTISGANGITSSITTGAAQTHITTGSGTVTGTTLDGIHAVTGGTGLIDIATNGAVQANVNGIFAMGTTGPVTITNNGSVTGNIGNGLEGVTGGAGTIQVNVQGPVSDSTGIFTQQTGSGTTNIVDTSTANTITGTKGDGIEALNGAGNGTVNVGAGPGTRLIADVTGNLDGIDISGAGTMNVYTQGNVTGAHGWGISAVSTGSNVNIDVTGGTIQGTANAGNGGGILGQTSGTKTVSINNTTTVIGLGAGSDGIVGDALGAGNVTIASTGPLVTGANDAIQGDSSGGIVTVGTTGAPITSVLGDATTTDAAIRTLNTTGLTTITTSAAASMAGDVNAAFGIASVSTTGQITINNAAQIGNVGAGNGVGDSGIIAEQLGAATTTGISITNSGAIYVDGGVSGQGGIVAIADSSGPGPNVGITVTNSGNITVTTGVADNYGIEGDNTGTGAVTLTNTATIDPAWVGMRSASGGNATVATSGNVTGVHTGLAAITTGGAAFTAKVTVTGNATIVGENHDGIFAGAFGAGGNVLVDTTAGGSVTGGNNGIQSIQEGAGTTTITTNDAITGQAGWGISARSIGGGNVSVTAGSGGNVTGTATAGAGGGILATTSNASSVTVASTTSVIGLGAGSDGIAAVSSGAGNVSVASTGPLVTGAVDAILGSSTGGSVTIGTSGAPITSQVGDATTTNAGIEADNTTGPISIVNHGDESHDGNASFGILAQNTGAGATGTIGIVNTGNIGAAGAGNGVNDAGILAYEANTGAAGAITINNTGNIFGDTNNTVSLNVGFGTATGTIGIGAVSLGTGNTSITNSGSIDPVAFGILSVTKGTVNIANSGNIAATAVGIDGISWGGKTVTISNTAATINVSAGDGIDAGVFLGNGALSITQGTGSVVASNNAVHAIGDGSVTIVSSGTETGTTGNGIEVEDIGGANVNINTSAGGNVFGGTNGIISTNTGPGSGSTTINTLTNAGFSTATNVTGAGGDGINATSSTTGNIAITAGNVFGSGAAGHTSNGVIALSTGGGNIAVTSQGNVEGDTTGNAGGTGATGITAMTTGGNGSVAVTVNTVNLHPFGSATTTVSGGNDGIVASSTGSGSTKVTIGFLGSGTVQATGAMSVDGNLGPVGILAIGGTGGGNLGNATAVSVITDADTFAFNGRAIVTNSGNDASIENDGFAVGSGASTVALGGTLAGNISYAVVDVTAVSGATTFITNDFVIESTNEFNGAFVAGLSDLAIRGTTGSVNLDNEDLIEGRVNFAGLTGTNSTSTFNDGEWFTNGVSTFSPTGNNAIENDDLIVTSTNQVRTTLAFGAGTNTILNDADSAVVVGYDFSTTGSAAAPAVTQITGTVGFTNNGTIILGSSNFDTSDRLINSVLIGTGTALGGTGQIDLDANLWSDTQSAAACQAMVLTAADCVVVASTSGNEGIQVLDTKAHALGAFNPTGIVIVVGSSAANTFHLAPTSDYFDGNPADAFLFGGHTDVLDKPGLFFYDLAYNSGDSTERLIGVPKATAFELPTVAGAVDGLWYTTTQTWFDRTTDQRDIIQGRADGTEPAVWLKTVGDWSHRSQTSTFTDFNQTYVFDTTFDQDTAGLLGGVDLLDVTDKGKAWVIGVETGTVQSDIRFRNTPDRFSVEATDLGGYATYLSGGLFIDGTLNANFLRLGANMPSAVMLPGGGLSGPPATSDTHGTSWGGQVEAGYNMPLGATAFWEPVGSLSYVDTTFDQIPLPGGSAALGNDQSFRGSLGLRLGMLQDFQYYKVKLAVTGRIWDEFDNDPTSTLLIPAGPNFTTGDNLKGVFGEVSGQANLFTTTSGLSAFLTGGIKFKTNYDEGTVTIGARYQF